MQDQTEAAMKKSKKRDVEKEKSKDSPKVGIVFLERLENPRFILGYFILLFLVIAFLYQPLIFEGMEPNGGDYVSNIGITKQILDWKENSGHLPLWNPYLFGGMPLYQHFGPKAWSIDNLLNGLDFLGDWRLWYFLAGALGMFLLIKFFGLPAIAAMVAALAFILMPHFQALIIVGHFAKFRALMWMPYVLLTFLYLIKTRTLLSGLIFCLAFAIQFRTQHYQIIFYTLMLLLFMGISPILSFIRQKEWKAIFQVSSLTLLAILFAFIISAQIFLSIREYTPYSTRGGYAISLEEDDQDVADKKGVGFDYATMWSYSVSEFWNLIIPMFHGGTSSEVYTGDAVPAFKNRELPTYWGAMPFTQSYEYTGIVLIFLAVIGIVLYWEKWEVKSLTFLTLFALIMSLGKNFAIFYKGFFYYIPYFDKFRAPVMILTLVMFNVSLLAAYGLAALLRNELNQKEIRQRLYIISGAFVFLAFLPLATASSFSLAHGDEIQRYGQEVVSMLKKVRLEMLQESALQSLLLLLAAAGSILAVQKKWLKKDMMALIILFLIAGNFIWLDNHYLKGKFVDPQRIEDQQYRANLIDLTLKNDPELYRVYPIGQLFSDVHWVYHHQSVGGYSPAKLQVIQEIADNCLYVNIDGRLPINWNIMKVLNVKYIIAPQQIQSDRLRLITQTQNGSYFAYQYLDALPRAFFVNHYTVIKDGAERLKMLNDPAFDPGRMAILEETPAVTPGTPDSTHVKILEYQPEKVVLETYTDQTALLVLSEIDYPPGWQAVIDGSEVLKIYKTDHLIRSVVLPAGNHQVIFTFRPRSYYAGLKISLFSIILIYILIIQQLYQQWGSKLITHWKTRGAEKK